MKLPETPQAILYELSKWEDIITSTDWITYKNALREHIAYLQKEANEHLRKQRNVEAFGALRAMDDNNRFLDSINIRMKALNDKIEKGG